MKKPKFLIRNLVIRYSLIILILFFGTSFLYSLLIPLSVVPIYLILNSLYGAMLNYTKILVENVEIEIVGSCVAASAYTLLFILNLATPNLSFLKRVYSIVFSFLTLFFVNLIRIFILSLLLIEQNPFFDVTHKIFWYGLSTLFVVAIWFFNVKLFKIDKIPFYSDLKLLKDLAKPKK